MNFAITFSIKKIVVGLYTSIFGSILRIYLSTFLNLIHITTLG